MPATTAAARTTWEIRAATCTWGRCSACSSPRRRDQVAHDDVVDTDDRPASYFTWHEHPWSLKDRGRTGQTYPGHDYLVGYWLGRASGQFDEDSKGRCLRWR